MKNIIICIIMCVICNNHIFSNFVFIEQDITYASNTNEEQTPRKSVFNNNINIESEPYMDLNKNGKYDYAEQYIDHNQNSKWDNAESFQDLNQDGIYDIQEPFIDKGNGIFDTGEEFIDLNGNKMRDLELWFVDKNNNDKWDAGEPFEDLNNDGIRGYKEPFTDLNNNNKYDAPEKVGDSKFTFNATTFSEPYIDIPNSRYDLDEEYEDLNGDGKWTPAEEYEDFNGDGKWTPAEEYEDLNGDGKWTPAEEYEDLNGDGKWTEGDEQHDLFEKNNLDLQDVETLLYDTLTTSFQNDIISNSSSFQRSFKSPGKALLYSGVLPGMGQIYMENWRRGLLFVALEGIAIGTFYQNNKLAEDKKQEYVNYSQEHWSFEQWIHDYYNWYEYKEGNDEWNSIRLVFTNYSDSTYGCAQDPTLGHCYQDIWDHSHKVEFTYDGRIMSSNSKEFKKVFLELCGNSNTNDKKCSKDILDIDMNDNYGDTIFVIKNHHFYEGTQKYDMYFSGWDDNESVLVIEKEHGDKNVTSPNQIAYRKLWSSYNTIKTLAVTGGKFMLLNRVVSIVDALILAKKWNNKHDVKISLNTYPDLRNKSGIGGFKLSLHFK